MKITFKFNILITFALIAYLVILSPISENNPTPLLVESIFPGNSAAQILAGLLSITLGMIASLLIIRSLWNRLFPHLCGWKEINLAESYAISIFVAMFVIQ